MMSHRPSPGPSSDRNGVTTPELSGLVATCVDVEPAAIDPFALAGPRGFLFLGGGHVRVGVGEAARIALPRGLDSDFEIGRIEDLLAAIPCDLVGNPVDGRAPGAVTAFGGLPFDRSAPATLVVPEIVYGCDGDRAWAIVLAPPESPLPRTPAELRSLLADLSERRPDPVAHSPATPGDRGGAEATVTTFPRAPDSDFLAMVESALDVIQRGELTKVVLSRQLDATAPETIDIEALLRRWCQLEPDCTIFSVPSQEGQFVGASPELLLERSGSDVISRPLAGTTERFAEPSGSLLPGDLLASVKDGWEHQIVVDALSGGLASFCAELDIPGQPDLVVLHNIVHLGTSLRGTLAPSSGGWPDALTLVAALHPTPAVGGAPVERARALIDRLEAESRGLWAGPMGYVDATGNGRWVLGIRSATVNGRRARLVAGVGIVEGSDPHTELAETNLKLAAVIEALAPNGHPPSSPVAVPHRTAT